MTRLFTLLLLVFGSLPLSAQLQFHVQGGFTLGTPFGEIPEGATGSPGLGPFAGAGLSWFPLEKWGLKLEAAYSQKGGQYLSPVSGSTSVSRRVMGVLLQVPFDVPYEGTASGEFRNRYWELPLSLVWRPSDRWSCFAGYYYAWLRKGHHEGEVDIEVAGLLNLKDQAFDESHNLRHRDYGVLVGTDVKLWQGLFFSFRGQVGLVSIFAKNPEGLTGPFRNIFVQTGLGYRLSAP
jgi:hypothetical protein